MLAMSLKFLLFKSGVLILYKRELVRMSKISKKSANFDFRAVIKRCVLAEGVACGTNIIDATLLAHEEGECPTLYEHDLCNDIHELEYHASLRGLYAKP